MPATAKSGRFSHHSHRHKPRVLLRMPPTTGPKAKPKPKLAAHSATARFRRLTGAISVINVKDSGIKAAVPAP